MFVYMPAFCVKSYHKGTFYCLLCYLIFSETIKVKSCKEIIRKKKQKLVTNKPVSVN